MRERSQNGHFLIENVNSFAFKTKSFKGDRIVEFLSARSLPRNIAFISIHLLIQIVYLQLSGGKISAAVGEILRFSPSDPLLSSSNWLTLQAWLRTLKCTTVLLILMLYNIKVIQYISRLANKKESIPSQFSPNIPWKTGALCVGSKSAE